MTLCMLCPGQWWLWTRAASTLGLVSSTHAICFLPDWDSGLAWYPLWSGGPLAADSISWLPSPCAHPVEMRLYCPIPSPAVSPLLAGSAADQELCIDQAVVFIEDAIKVCGGYPSDLESALSLCSLLSWGGCLDFRKDTMLDTWTQLSSCPLMEAIFLVLESWSLT